MRLEFAYCSSCQVLVGMEPQAGADVICVRSTTAGERCQLCGDIQTADDLGERPDARATRLWRAV